MNYLKRKLNKWFGWFNDNRLKVDDIIDPSVFKAIKELDEHLPKVIDNLNKLRNELSRS